jgi:hypothetical protein
MRFNTAASVPDRRLGVVLSGLGKGDRNKDTFKFVDPSFHGALLMVLMIPSMLPSYKAKNVPRF